MSHRTGDLLGGRYRLDDQIAVGGMGEVWRATDTVLRRAIAVKTLREDRATDPQFRIRFQHEARAMAALHHPGIADVYDFGEQPSDETYLVMADIEGQPLNERIAERGRLTVSDAMSIVAQVARALQAAHEAGIVHRDVKPGNIIVQPDGRAVLVDFGVARSARSASLTGADEVIGTAHYLAPEQLRKQPVGPATDMYALGAVAYHCLAGHPPFLGDNPIGVAAQHVSQQPPPLPPDVPPPVRNLVATALAKDPAARFPSAAAMARAAERAAPRTRATATATTLRLNPIPESPGRPPVRPRLRGIVTALILALLALAGTATALALTDPFGRNPARPATSATPTSGAATTRAPASPAITGHHYPGPTPSASPVTTAPEPTPTTTLPTTKPTTTTATPTTTPPTTTTTPTDTPPTTGRATGPPATAGRDLTYAVRSGARSRAAA
ncbi:serine/threonine protein kinase [Actinoplanes sp. KI2]|uniref:serine/threonine-protein kinase n=1 Tax=Actinoplanes sp. KI2 TaxID=2983315 RepID=UPI0021D5F738|nr:serine/threonine-protein kinase [Actinoplanes sp. KI2]MCU7729432.1 serine/threonine protein kinase [Actinoplanes sp. KI2]